MCTCRHAWLPWAAVGTRHPQPVEQRLWLDLAITVDDGDAAAGEIDARRLDAGEGGKVRLDLGHGLRAVGLRHEELDALEAGTGGGDPACGILTLEPEGLEIFAVDGAAGKGHGVSPFTTKRKILW